MPDSHIWCIDRTQSSATTFVLSGSWSDGNEGVLRIPQSSSITEVWMHHLDAYKMAGEEARRQLHKNASSNIEQVLEATLHKAPTIEPLPLITKTIQARRTRHAGHCWRNKDEFISDELLWTPAYGRAKAGRPARSYIQQLCEDTGCNPEDLPEAMNDREKWRERFRDIRASGTTWWWWTIRWLNIISRTLTGLVLPLCRDAVGVLYNNSRLG